VERILTYAEAIREATDQEMARDSSVIVLGMGVDDFKAIYGTTRGLRDKFGADRVFDTPLSEDGMTGVAIGAALAGLRPIHIHIRMDFVLLAMNQIVNIAAKARYMYGGSVTVPIVVRSIIGRSWGQGAKHYTHYSCIFQGCGSWHLVAPTMPRVASSRVFETIIPWCS
jgi:pyruvate/2-oxoglutarate/acetoin dehydrogenase E1 component